MLRLSVLLCLALLARTGHALTLDSTPVPGGIAVITLPDDADPATARYGDRKVLVTRNQRRLHRCYRLATGNKARQASSHGNHKQGTDPESCFPGSRQGL